MNEDFQVIVFVGNIPFSKHIITGIESLMKLPKYNKTEKIKPKITLELNDFELPSLYEAYASVPIMYNKSKSVEISNNESDNNNQSINETSQNSSSFNNTSKKSKSQTYETKIFEITEYDNSFLNITSEFLLIPKPLTEEEISSSKSKLEKLALKE